MRNIGLIPTFKRGEYRMRHAGGTARSLWLVDEAVNAGCNEVMLHNPWGREAGEVIDFDGLLEMIEAGRVSEAMAVEEMLVRLTIKYPAMPTWVYLGSLADEDAPADRGAFEDWVWASVDPILDAARAQYRRRGVTSLGLCFDRATGFEPRSREYAVIRELEAELRTMGSPGVMVEGGTSPARCWSNVPVCVLWETFLAKRAEPMRRRGGGVIAWANRSENLRDPGFMEKVEALGYAGAVWTPWWAKGAA